MGIGMRLVDWSTGHPRLVAGLMVFVTVFLAVLAAAPSLAPSAFPMLNPARVDTDPENMLSEDEGVRVFHNQMQRLMDIHDMVVVGVVNDDDPNGVFNVDSLNRVYALAEFAKTLQWPSRQGEGREGVLVADMLAPSTVDNIEQGSPGEVRFEWLMKEPPSTPEEALAVRDKALRIPFLRDTLVSQDGKAVALYLPITSKDLSYRIYRALQGKIAEFEGNDRFFITGMPVAEDTFGVEMFIQMGISAPLAMLVIFVLMLVFFRKPILVVSPMIVALVSVIITMGLLVAMGYTIHIMSSMIPIFIMPIAVLDSIHIISEFFELYQKTRDRKKTVHDVMETLFMPMLYTSLTSAAGFASLALTPIPPVQVFGLYVAAGVMFAWLLTVTFIPAFVMFIPERRLENFGMKHQAAGDGAEQGRHTAVGQFLVQMDRLTYRYAKLIIALSVILLVVGAYGITKIEINDNPTKWFKSTHPIRVADRVLNEHFGGTYMAYLALRPADEPLGLPASPSAKPDEPASAPDLPPGLGGPAESGAPVLPAGLGGETPSGAAEPELPAGLGGAPLSAEETPAIPEVVQQPEIFKEPEVLAYVEGLQEYLNSLPVIGKTNSLADIVKTVHRELLGGGDEQFRIPDSAGAVAQCLMQYESSHRPQDLWHMVTPEYRTLSIWVQLKSGDNRDMTRVVADVDEYIRQHPLPKGLEHQWFGKTYLNVVWQDKMVKGMLFSFAGSFMIVLLMMIVLFRSGMWGFLSMIPLTVTIVVIYGITGFVGKAYDMPVAVLSSLTLGLAVDFAIHFLARSRTIYLEHGSWAAAHGHVFSEPARAITRNVIVIAVGFTPLLFAPLVPYITVGLLMGSILLLSGGATLVMLPALIRVMEPLLFPKTKVCCVTCQCGTCILTGITAILVAVLNVKQFLSVGWTSLTWISLAGMVILALVCNRMARRDKCNAKPQVLDQ